jgi:pyruvate/2-oxoglutarate dehydrogenase complex dihydrolipoamide dehydrogenase (E3) component
VVVIGAGAGGLVTAAGSSGVGARVAIIEQNLLGGDCLNVGCVPSKCLIKSAKVAKMCRSEAEKYGVVIEGEVKVDFGKVMERMRRLRACM